MLRVPFKLSLILCHSPVRDNVIQALLLVAVVFTAIYWFKLCCCLFIAFYWFLNSVYRFVLSLCFSKENSSDVLTIQDEEENHFFLEQTKNFHDGLQTVWLGIYYNIDSKSNHLLSRHLMICVCSVYCGIHLCLFTFALELHHHELHHHVLDSSKCTV